MIRQLIFENGAHFTGTSFGAITDCVAEITVNSSMVGYQELLTDPKALSTMALMTYPLIGCYGLTEEDNESMRPCLSALIVREVVKSPTNYRYVRTLPDVMEDHGIPGLMGVDTRMIAKMVRDEGAMRALLTDMDVSPEEGARIIRQTQRPRELFKAISTRRLWFSRTPNFSERVVVLDLGVRRSTIKRLNALGADVVVAPYATSAGELLSLSPDGLLISDGPGEAHEAKEAIALVKALSGKLPILGLGLGHEIIALASGAAITRMARPHRSGAESVRDLRSAKILTTAQDHAFCVTADSLPGTGLSVSHVNVLDGTIEGLENREMRMFGAQFAGEALDEFIAMIKAYKQEAM